MQFVTTELAMAHCRGDAGDEALIALYVAAAQDTSIDYLNRRVFATPQEMAAAIAAGTAGEHPMVVTDAIRAAILLTAGHLYANREDVVVGVSAAQLPSGAKSLLYPKRISPGL